MKRSCALNDSKSCVYILLKESDIGHNIFAEREYPYQF